jgi:hypothetical protein
MSIKNSLPFMTFMPAKMAKCIFKNITKKTEWRRKTDFAIRLSPFCPAT